APLARARPVVARLVHEHDHDEREQGRGGQGAHGLEDPAGAPREAVGALEVRAPARGAVLLARLRLLAAVRARSLRRVWEAGKDLAHVLARAGTGGVPEILVVVRHPTQELKPVSCGAQREQWRAHGCPPRNRSRRRSSRSNAARRSSTASASPSGRSTAYWS